MLLVINGAPAVGKSTLAARYAEDHPLALVIDVDLMRTHLGGWQRHDQSKAIARDLAIALARAHASRGYEVVVPQYIGRPEFLTRLREVAQDVGVPFVEVVLTDDAVRIADRFRGRRAEHVAIGAAHPEYDVAEEAIDRYVAGTQDALVRDAGTRGVAVIDVGNGPDDAYRALSGREPS